jgi:hypothetical protein
MKKVLILIISLATLLTAVYGIVRDPLGPYRYCKWLLTGDFFNAMMPMWMVVTTGLAHLILIMRIIAFFGLIKLKTWGKYLAVVTLGTDFVIRLVGLIHTLTYYSRHPESRRILEDLKSAISSGQIQHAELANKIPSFFIAVICLISIIILVPIDFEDFDDVES